MKRCAVRRPFGRGSQVSLFTLGTMRAVAPVETMAALLETALYAGINHLETAPAYGQAEYLLGQALHHLRSNGQEPEGGWRITSKLLPGCTFEDGCQQLRGTLQRLGLTCLPHLAIHGLNLQQHLDWALQGAGRDLIAWARNESLVELVGFSSHGNNHLIADALDSGNFDFCSLHVHLLDPQRLPLAKQALKAGLGVIAISPADKGGHLQNPTATLEQDCYPFSPLELAYRYLIALGISTITVGATTPSDLNLAAQLARADGPLSISEQTAVNVLFEQRRNRVGTSFCGQCRACLPCPHQVPIPELLRLRNLAIGHDLITYANERYNLIGRAGHWWEQVDARACRRCGDCLPRCPYNLPIPDLLADTHRRLAASPRRRLWG